MLEEVKILLGDAAANYTDALISLCIKQAIAEVEAYCKRDLDLELEMIAQRIAIIKLNRVNSEGLASQGFSGVSESYIDGYPADIIAILNRKRKIKAV
ncbi:MAG: phage head-tail connector protein [Campylobacter sp.]|uniref:phage head-tail connector protein n=1 Tax=Campylobacter sp. TaxID=205 RepID=UPI001B05918B|nr:phage head-tail connector protein [Campylobacter sp.]MBO5062899.1 phage head-tail connector protein [Campylobacter sp.]